MRTLEVPTRIEGTVAEALTVIVPAFNAELTLAAALQSVAEDSVEPSDVIVIDDGSQDRTAEIAQACGTRYLHQDNAGPASARNAGVRLATTSLVAFLDADDTVPVGGIRGRAALLGQSDLLITGADESFGRDGRLLTFSEVANEPAIVKSPSGWLARRDALLAVGGFRNELRCLEDVEIVMRLLASGQEVKICSAPMFDYSGVTPGRRRVLGHALLYIAAEMASQASPFSTVASESRRNQLAVKYLKHAANVFAMASDRDGLRSARATRRELGLALSPELLLASTPRLYSAMLHVRHRQTQPGPQLVPPTNP